MAEARPRVLVDTNVWISAFINVKGAPARVLDAFLADRFVPVISDALLDEIREVVQRPRVRRRWQVSGEDLETALDLLRDRAIQATPTGDLRLCRDPNDDILLETAIVGGAQYFVSRDDDIKRDEELMAQLAEHGVDVRSVARFLVLLDARSS